MKKIGLIINPIAGMGGSVGLKGTDGPEAVKRARDKGVKPSAGERAATALRQIKNAAQIQFIAGSGEMGEMILKQIHPNAKITVVNDSETKNPYSTSRLDTLRMAKEIANAKADLLLFCGGDGTARDLLDAIDEELPVIGIPAGVKMHSAVFAITPEAAGTLTSDFLEGGLELHEAEVMDVDEEAYRQGRLAVTLYGLLKVPQEPFLVQTGKAVMPDTVDEKENVEAIARQVVEEMNPNTLYILCAGSTAKAVADQLHQPKTLLGVDIFKHNLLVEADVGASELRALVAKETEVKIIVSPIGQQGLIFGRGTQQITPDILRKVGRDNVIIIASQAKIAQLKTLYVDTGDAKVDAFFRGYMKVMIDYRLWRVVEVR